MFCIWDSISALRQPCLAEKLPINFLNEDGLVSGSTYRSLESLLWEHVECRLSKFQLSDGTLDSLPLNEKWLNTSALQKSIRRGHVELAATYAQRSVAIDAKHTFRRLAIIALEDVGAANLLWVAACLAVLGDSNRRKGCDESRLAVLLASELARGLKSRLACDFLSLVEYDHALIAQARAWQGSSDANLSEIADSQRHRYEIRLLALWLLAGPGRYPGRNLPKQASRSRQAYMLHLAQKREPLILQYIAERASSRLRDSLFIPYALIAEVFCDTDDWVVKKQAFERPVMIGSYPAEAYDMHTREGASAIRKFDVNCTSIRETPDFRCRSFDLANAVFRAEGGLLDQAIENEMSRRISDQATTLELTGSLTADTSSALEAIRKEIPSLNKLRRQYAVSGMSE